MRIGTSFSTKIMQKNSKPSQNSIVSEDSIPTSLALAGWRIDSFVFLCALAVLTSAMVLLHGLNSGLSGSDEASHFLNGYLIFAYLTEAIGHNPLTYATDFYIHYPKISIGHWPPLYYVFLSVFFFFLPHAPLSFMIVNLVVGALPALLIARVVRKVTSWQWGFLAGVSYVLMPICLNNTVRIMLEQAIAGLCLLAAILWSGFAKNPNLRSGLAYAAITAIAILVKGNGWVLAVFPIFHIALTGNWSILLNWRTYASGVAAIVVVGAWTVVTYKISSDGFNYSWGLDYFLKSAPIFLAALYANLGPFGLIAATIGLVGSFFSKDRPDLRELGLTCLALILATLIFHSIVPVDIDARYMSSAIPPLAIFMALGAWMVTLKIKNLATVRWFLILVVLTLFAIPGIALLRDRPVRFDMRMDVVAEQIVSHPGGMVAVIDGHPGTEGALASEVAIRDSDRLNYVVRSSQLLAKSDFMGNRYTLLVDTPQAVLRLLDDVTCTAVVLAEGDGIFPRSAHSDLLLSALRLPSSPYKLTQTYTHHRQNGRTYLYMRSHPLVPNKEAVKRVSFPEKALSL